MMTAGACPYRRAKAVWDRSARADTAAGHVSMRQRACREIVVADGRPSEQNVNRASQKKNKYTIAGMASRVKRLLLLGPRPPWRDQWGRTMRVRHRYGAPTHRHAPIKQQRCNELLRPFSTDSRLAQHDCLKRKCRQTDLCPRCTAIISHRGSSRSECWCKVRETRF